MQCSTNSVAPINSCKLLDNDYHSIARCRHRCYKSLDLSGPRHCIGIAAHCLHAQSKRCNMSYSSTLARNAVCICCSQTTRAVVIYAYTPSSPLLGVTTIMMMTHGAVFCSPNSAAGDGRIAGSVRAPQPAGVQAVKSEYIQHMRKQFACMQRWRFGVHLTSSSC